jgi:hypothetical protein
MTCPFTFSSPPSVEFHLLNGVVGTLKAGARAKEEVARGSYSSGELAFELKVWDHFGDYLPHGRDGMTALCWRVGKPRY